MPLSAMHTDTLLQTLCARSHLKVHDAHIQSMVDQYKGVVAINLVNQHKTGAMRVAQLQSSSAVM